MILIEPKRPGAMWLRALAKYYARKHKCTMIFYPGGKCEYAGRGAKKAQYAMELALGTLLIRCINAIASAEIGTSSRTVIHNTTRDFVKETYKGADVQAG